MTRLVDLTRALKPLDEASFPDIIKPLFRIISPEIEYIDNQKGAEIMMEIFGCSKEDLPEGEGWGEDNLKMSSHMGTHVDAPLHYGSTCGGERAKAVDEIDLHDLYLPAIVLDMTHKRGSGSGITVSDLESALDKIGCDITGGEAVLIRTDHDKFAINDPARYNYPGMTRESAQWLADKGAKVGGTDALGWDRPFHVMIAEYQKTRDKKFIWDAHFAHRDKEFFVVQQLVNLDSVPSSGFKVAFFPIKLVGASAAPARVVAFLED
ncbi:cyclase family protein [Candidatus Obscuribacterales bacterium]|nr:cyclase family protein [Candidatus Obscuribacterales bacterium]MBX3136409.1 cyclase family protein [Candidatus Obscuribacterales bacterium]MBX3153641.1 cyclase family protein [Candidatus Obscuribacterales bacterium]